MRVEGEARRAIEKWENRMLVYDRLERREDRVI